jgi:hypothetical protein
MSMLGFRASECTTFRLCAESGLGPCTLDDIEVVGEPIQEIGFDLTRLRNGVSDQDLYSSRLKYTNNVSVNYDDDNPV